MAQTQHSAFVVNRAAGDQVRINVRAKADMKAIRKEKRNGRDVVIVPSATMPDDIVMNEILYPADEIGKSFKSLERSPAPLGHPTINGKFVSARDPEGINMGWIGAWNENLRREDGRVFLDKVIDVETANRSEGGKRVLDAIDKGEPVHTSTGLLCTLEAANGDVDYTHIARSIEFDHDAILLDQDGAATPAQGVGMMVNAAGKDIEVIHSDLGDAFDQEIDWAGTRLVEAVRRKADASKWQELKDRILEALGLSKSERSTSTNNQENDMTVSKEQIDALSGKVDGLSETITKALADQATTIGNAVAAALKPLVDGQEAIANAQKAKDDAELAGLIDKIVKANLLEEATAKELTLNAARELAKKAEPGQAAALNGAYKPGGTAPGFKLPQAEEK